MESDTDAYGEGENTYDVTPTGYPITVHVNADHVDEALETAWHLFDPPKFDLTDLHAFEVDDSNAEERAHEDDTSQTTEGHK